VRGARGGTPKDELKAALIEAGTVLAAAGFTRKATRWSRPAPAPLSSVAFDLQRSNYGPTYFANVYVFPVEHASKSYPIGTRLDAAVTVEGTWLADVLSGDVELPVGERVRLFRLWLEQSVLPLLDRVSTLEGLRTAVSGGRWLVEPAVRERLQLPWPADAGPNEPEQG
jgi:hypothetical protein